MAPLPSTLSGILGGFSLVMSSFIVFFWTQDWSLFTAKKEEKELSLRFPRPSEVALTGAWLFVRVDTWRAYSEGGTRELALCGEAEYPIGLSYPAPC